MNCQDCGTELRANQNERKKAPNFECPKCGTVYAIVIVRRVHDKKGNGNGKKSKPKKSV